MQHESDLRTFFTALTLAVICSFLVSGAAVALKPLQAKNKELERRKNVLIAGGLYTPGMNVEKAFKSIDIVFADIKTGDVLKGNATDYFNRFKVLSTGPTSIKLTKQQDVAGIKSIPSKIPVFLVKNPDGSLKKVILPIYGSGLWSTMYGFLALDPDLDTVSGITYYDQAETPGLGGEVANPQWQKGWVGKKIYDKSGKVVLALVKGGAQGDHQVDALSGATLTSRGVQRTIHFWMGPNGFKKFFEKLKQGAA